MLPTTSAKCVRLLALTSFFSCQANISVLILACCCFVVSDMPLTITFCLINLVYKHHLLSSWLTQSIKGQLILSSSGLCEFNGERVRIKKHIMSLSGFGVLLRFDSGDRYILWRDSVSDRHYRQFLMFLRREQ
ncbi:protein YgfX [Vibrio hepatarius]|uniref:protein YgfX n=1 Tax=Vibrio hepatarius TaxID=171383 RepID=UPI00339D8A11